MQILTTWQYKYVEYCLYGYQTLKESIETEQCMKNAIDKTLSFFKGTLHEQLIVNFYFQYYAKKNKWKRSIFFRKICRRLHIEEATGYVMRREIIYRVAMYCYQLQIYR